MPKKLLNFKICYSKFLSFIPEMFTLRCKNKNLRFIFLQKLQYCAEIRYLVNFMDFKQTKIAYRKCIFILS